MQPVNGLVFVKASYDSPFDPDRDARRNCMLCLVATYISMHMQW